MYRSTCRSTDWQGPSELSVQQAVVVVAAGCFEGHQAAAAVGPWPWTAEEEQGAAAAGHAELAKLASEVESEAAAYWTCLLADHPASEACLAVLPAH